MRGLLRALFWGVLFGLVGVATAKQNDYGGYDIVESNSMYAAGYGTARDWQVMAAFEGSAFVFCYAEPQNETADSRVRIGWDSQQWQLAVPIRAASDWEGTFEVDGRGGGNGGGTQASGTSAGGRAIVWLQLGDVELLGAGNNAIVGIGKQDFDFSLTGAKAAILKIEECVERNGKPPSKPEPRAGSAGSLRKSDLGKIGDWEIARYTQGGRLAYCEAITITGTETGLRFTIREDGGAFGFSGYASAAIGDRADVTYWINGDRSSATTDTATLESDASGFEWMMIFEGNDQPGMLDDELPNGRQLSFSYGVDGEAHVETYPLKSSNAVVNRLIDCRDGR